MASSSGAAKFGRRAGRSTGWGNDDTPVGGSSANAPDAQGEARKPKFEQTNVSNIQEIPELEFTGDASDIKKQVADAPNIQMHRVQSLKELDHDILYQLPNTVQDGVDLSLLTATLVPQTKTVEEDEPWNFDQLFTSLSAQMRKEEDAKAQESKSTATSGEDTKKA